MAPSRVRTSTSRHYRHTVKRQLGFSLTLPKIQEDGFSHPQNGCWLKCPQQMFTLLTQGKRI